MRLSSSFSGDYSIVPSLKNKIDEYGKVDYDSNFRRSHLIYLTEIWLKEDTTNVALKGYTTVRADRDELTLRLIT